MNLIETQIESIKLSSAFINYFKSKHIENLIINVPVETVVEETRERDLDRERPMQEREREYLSQFDEPEMQVPEYPFQDFNYGP